MVQKIARHNMWRALLRLIIHQSCLQQSPGQPEGHSGPQTTFLEIFASFFIACLVALLLPPFAYDAADNRQIAATEKNSFFIFI